MKNTELAQLQQPNDLVTTLMKNYSFNQHGGVKRLASFAIALAGGLVGFAAGVAGAETVAMSGGVPPGQGLASSENTLVVFAMSPVESLAALRMGGGYSLNNHESGSASEGFVVAGLSAGSLIGRSVVALDLSGFDPTDSPTIAQTLRDPGSPLSGRPFNQFDSEQTIAITPLGEVDGDVVRDPSIAPLPPAAWAGFSTLALGAGVGYIRRRRIARA